VVNPHQTKTPKAYGEVVWSWRRDAGVKPCGIFREAMVTTSPLTKESTK
jgi:hypothetical protein